MAKNVRKGSVRNQKAEISYLLKYFFIYMYEYVQIHWKKKKKC